MNKKLWFFINSGVATPYPLTLSPLSWWDNGATYMAADGSQWTDRMGLYNLTAAGTARPTYTAGAQNGLPSFAFDGTTDVLTGARITQIQGVNGLTMWSAGKKWVFTHYDAGNSNLRTEFIHNSDNLNYGIVANTATSLGTHASPDAFNYSLLVYDGTQGTNETKLKLYLGGVAQTVSFTLTIPATTESSASSLIRMGKFFGGFKAGQSLEHGIITRAITAGEITSLNSYLAAKYAL
jgi:hypothetical protein